MALSFKEDIKNLTETISKFEPKIDESIKVINDLETKIKTIRESSYKKLTDIVNNINNLFISKNQLFLEEYTYLLEATDEDISEVNQRLKALQSRVSKFIVDSHDIQKFIAENLNKNTYNNSLDMCEFKQRQKLFIAEANKIFSHSKFLISSKVEISINKAKEKIQHFQDFKKCLFNKIKLFRSSIINSIQTGISSFSLRVRRFTKFVKTGIKYYKTSSLKLRTSAPVSIVGFSICGLYIDENLKKNYMQNTSYPNDRSNSISIVNSNLNINNADSSQSNNQQSIHKQLNHSNTLSTNNTHNEGNNHISKSATKSKNPNIALNSPIGDHKVEIKIPFQFTISEIKTEDANTTEQLISENFYLREIINTIDPTLSFYLNKSINISPEKKYIVSITNLNNEVYLELWSGEVSKYFINLLSQNIKCNSSLIKFEFTPPDGIESDFDEFNSGIIADLIYSYKEEK